MDLPPLLKLPTEILINILKFTIYSPGSYITLIKLAQTCTHLHHAIFCSENDSIWRGPALALGIHESLQLEQILYPGSSAVQRRLWQNVVKLSLGWSRPFPAATPTVPRLQKAPKELPPPDRKGDWFGRRTIELFTYGEGSRKGAAYWSKHASVKDDGCVVFQVRPEKGVTATNSTGLVTGVLDPALGKIKGVALEWKAQNQWTATPFPISAGFLVEERNGEYRVRAVDAPEMGLSQSWNLGKRVPDRFVSNGEILVAVTFPDSTSSVVATQIPSNLLCVESVGAETEAKSKVVWEFDLSTEWAEDEPYTSFPHLKNFHITRKYLVCLVTRHPSSTLGKLTRTNFIVVSLETGMVIKTMKFITESLPATIRAAFTTAFAHDFLLTDTHIVSGGLGGGLLVWDYSQDHEGPIYKIPDPIDSDANKVDDAPSLLRQYSALSLSADGRFIGATTSDKLWLFDMVEKKVHGVYSNGRKIKKSDFYTKNPFDDFPAGVWCWWREWRNCRNIKTGDVGWEEVKGSEGVAYLTDLGNEGNPMNMRGIFQKIGSPGEITYLLDADDMRNTKGVTGKELRGVKSYEKYCMGYKGEFLNWAFLVVVPVVVALIVATLIRFEVV